MENEEPAQKAAAAIAFASATAKPAAVAKKVVEKKKEKKESQEFVIETTVATPQLMKSLVGDNSQIIPNFEEEKEESVVPKPTFAPKVGLQAAQP
jgi:hypothetical protein